jgi:hypothetical protein
MNNIKTSSFYITLDWVFEFNENCNKDNAYNYIIKKLDFNDPLNGWYKLFENIYGTENNKNYDGYIHSVVQKEQLSFQDWMEDKENIDPNNTLYITCYLLYQKDNDITSNKDKQKEHMKKAIEKYIEKIKYINKDNNEVHASIKIKNIVIEDFVLSKHHEINNLTNSMYSARLYEI